MIALILALKHLNSRLDEEMKNLRKMTNNEKRFPDNQRCPRAQS